MDCFTKARIEVFSEIVGRLPDFSPSQWDAEKIRRIQPITWKQPQTSIILSWTTSTTTSTVTPALLQTMFDTTLVSFLRASCRGYSPMAVSINLSRARADRHTKDAFVPVVATVLCHSEDGRPRGLEVVVARQTALISSSHIRRSCPRSSGAGCSATSSAIGSKS